MTLTWPCFWILWLSLHLLEIKAWGNRGVLLLLYPYLVPFTSILPRLDIHNRIYKNTASAGWDNNAAVLNWTLLNLGFPNINDNQLFLCKLSQHALWAPITLSSHYTFDYSIEVNVKQAMFKDVMWIVSELIWVPMQT